MGMKVADCDLIPGYGLVAIFMSVGEHRRLRRMWVLSTQIEIHGHTLPGSWRCVIQGEVALSESPRLLYAPVPKLVGHAVWTVHLFSIGLPDSHRECFLVVLPVKHVAEIQFDLAC